MNLEKLKTGSTINGDSGNDPKKLPDWMDLDRFRRGQQFFQRHIAAAIFGVHCFLTVGFGMTNIVKALAFTRKTESPPQSLLRYLKTYVHVVLWHTQDVWDENTLGHKSTQTVRKIHGAVRKAMESQNPGKTFVSQYDMALVQSAFLGPVLVYPSSFGIKCTKQEVEDYVFFWRGIGYLLGIKDEFNLCSGNYEETYRVCKELEHEFAYRCVVDPPAEAEALANAYIDGANRLFNCKWFTKESLIVFAFNIMGLDSSSVKLSWVDKLRITVHHLYIMLLRWMPGFERFLNFIHFAGFQKQIYLTEKEFRNKAE